MSAFCEFAAHFMVLMAKFHSCLQFKSPFKDMICVLVVDYENMIVSSG